MTNIDTDSGLGFRAADFASLTEALDYAAGGRSGMTFLGPRGRLMEALPYPRLAEQAREVGARLLGRGLEPGDRVALLAETQGDFARAFAGCLYARLLPCPMPLPAAFGSRAHYLDQIRRIADTADIRAALAPGDFAGWVEEALADRGLAFLGDLSALDAAPAPLPAPAGEDEIAYLQFSSGTTRAPKGIAVTHRALMANLRGMAEAGLGVGPGDRGVTWLPLYHDMGLVGAMLLPMATQMSVDYLPTQDFIRRPGLWLEMIARGRGTISYAPSFGYELAARRARTQAGLDLSSWRVAGIGGDMVRPAAVEAFAEAFAPAGFDAGAFLPSYGLAEATLALTFPPRGRGLRVLRPRPGINPSGAGGEAAPDGAAGLAFVSCGAALPGHEIEIRDPEGRTRPEGLVGRIHARGPSLMTGYFRDPEQTAEALSEGWLDTGDLGYLQDGELTVTGRAKDLIILNGRNIWPQDIEWTVEDAVEALRSGDAAAFGLAPPDAPGAEEVVVVVRCRSQDPERRAALRAEVEDAVARAHGLQARVALCAAGGLPKTSSGKLSRPRTRDMFLAGDFDA